MRNRVHLVLLAALGLSFTACDFEQSAQGSPAFTEQGPPSPVLMQYAEDFSLGRQARYSATTWRTETDDQRTGGTVHIVNLGECPDRYRVTVSGIEQSDAIYIGTTMYQRSGDHWVTKTIPALHSELSACNEPSAIEADKNRIRLVAEQLKGIEIGAPQIREVSGRKCREWTRTVSFGKRSTTVSSCYDLENHALLRSSRDGQVTTYYLNVPVDIKPPS